MAVVGGGIAGLAAAFEILEAAGDRIDLTLFEAEPRAGGNIRTEESEGYRVEWAVNGFLDNAPDTLDLVRRLGIADRLVRANPAAARRYIYHGGRLHLAPLSPPAFLASPLLSIAGRARVLAEPFVPRRSESPERDESVFDFAARRIGREAAAVLVDAMVTGVFAGNARELSLASTFPKMAEMEREHGSLVKAMIAKRRAARSSAKPSGGPAGPGGHLTSFREGMEELPRALVSRLSGRVAFGAPVESIGSAASGAHFTLRTARGDAREFDAIILACPSWRSAEIVSLLDAELARLLGEIPSAPVAVVALGFRIPDLGTPPDGFGFLIPRGEGLRALGALFDSNLFPSRAPEGCALVRLLIGGAHEPGLVNAPELELADLARETLRRACGIDASPAFMRIVRHTRGIPQYTRGHGERLAAIDDRLGRLQGLLLTGNSYRGVSVNACISEARSVGTRV